jgi:anthranilate phosphoribosyltransferase
MLLAAIEGRYAPARDIVLLNAGASLYVSGVAADLRDGVERAREVVESGAARARLDKLGELSRSFAN